MSDPGQAGPGTYPLSEVRVERGAARFYVDCEETCPFLALSVGTEERRQAIRDPGSTSSRRSSGSTRAGRLPDGAQAGEASFEHAITGELGDKRLFVRSRRG